jgi:hypothetical protein
LDDLYREAVTSAKAKLAGGVVAKARARWHARWRDTGLVRIFRGEEDLGVFRELTHPTGARRLVRTEGQTERVERW